MQTLAAISLLVRDYDEAIEWFTRCLGFVVTEDRPLGDKRWVTLAPGNHPANGSDTQVTLTQLVLARASNPAQHALIGQQMGGRVGFFLRTDTFDAAYQGMREAGVTFREEPRFEDYGSVVVFEDLYGKGWDLLGPPRDGA